MKKLDKFYGLVLKFIPVCASFMLVSIVNSTTTWGRGQDKMPENSKRYRKF